MVDDILGTGFLATVVTGFFKGFNKLGGVLYYKELNGIADQCGIPLGG